MYRSADPRQKTFAAIASGALVIAMAVVLIIGLTVNRSAPRPANLIAIPLALPPAPKPGPPPPSQSRKPLGARYSENLRNRSSPVIAAPNPLPSTPIVAATKPTEGDAAQSGAADRAGPGEGAGGTGAGAGGGGIAIEPVQIRGRLSVDDFPFGLIGPGERASVRLSYVVEIDGRVTTCRIQRSSGFAEVDAMACRLIEQRFRYRPARNAAGEPVSAGVEETHTWFRRPS